MLCMNSQILTLLLYTTAIRVLSLGNNEGTDAHSINIGNIWSNVYEIITVFKESDEDFIKNN